MFKLYEDKTEKNNMSNIQVLRDFPVGRNIQIIERRSNLYSSSNDLFIMFGTIVGYSYNSVQQIVIDVLPVREHGGDAPEVRSFNVYNEMYMFNII